MFYSLPKLVCLETYLCDFQFKVLNYIICTNILLKKMGIVQSDLCTFCNLTKEDVKPWSQGWLIAAGAYPGFCSMKRLEVFLLPLDGMLVHRRSLPRNFVRFPQQIAGTHLYTWVERGTVRVKCLAQEHNTLSPARARTRTARSGVERTNHEATAPPITKEDIEHLFFSCSFSLKFWKDFELCWKKCTNSNIYLTSQDVILGISGNNTREIYYLLL